MNALEAFARKGVGVQIPGCVPSFSDSLAQWIERLVSTEQVEGSSPSGVTILGSASLMDKTFGYEPKDLRVQISG
jgi:hypothetical protein